MVWFPTGGGSVRPRHIAAIALVLGLIVVAFLGTRLYGEGDARLDAQHRAEVAAAQIRARVEQGSSLAESLSRFMASLAGSPDASQEFESTASRWLSPAGFPAAAWIEQIPGSQRAAYERRTGNPIVTIDRQLRIVPAGLRSSYLPATLVSGIPPMETPGIDLGDESGVAAAVTRASALDEVCATPLSTLRDGEEGLFLISFAPSLTGGIVRPAFVALFVSEPSLHAAVTDTTPVLLAVGGTSVGGLGGTAAERDTFTEAGQRFEVAAPLESVAGAAVLPWIVLAASLVLAVLLGALSVNAARRAKAKAEVDRLFTLTPDLITVAGFDGLWKRVNPAFETRLGYAEREALARPYLEFVHPDDRERTEEVALSLAEGKTMLAFENRLVCKDGSYRWIEWAATAVPREGVIYGVGRDVTERRQAESELRRLAGEQAARRRVATLVATGVSPTEVFSAVAEEVERLLNAQATAIGRLELDGEMAIVASSGTTRDVLPVGSRVKLESEWALATVIRTGRSARVDSYGRASESVRRRPERLGVRSTVAVPIRVEGSLWGSIAAGTDHEQFPADAEQRMAEFTDLVATAIANADSRSQLAASRRRIVAAADEARRQIERNLHDGTQQRLVSLGLAVRAAEADVPPDRRGLRVELSGIATGLMDAVAELREISRGVHPAILSEAGLGPALRTLARRSAIPVDLDVRTDTRLSEPIEVAAYFVASEALANAAKHAQASHMEIVLAMRDGSLVLSIRDDGIGGADPGRGSGLVGLRDRVEALGGTIRIDSPPGGGTSLAVTLPIDVEPLPSAGTDDGRRRAG
jgi:PAS domain S-box-containing protein